MITSLMNLVRAVFIAPYSQSQDRSVDMADAATMLDKCNECVPLLGVTRQFDFGQFIELYDPGTGANPIPVPIVVDPIGNLRIADLVHQANAGAANTQRSAQAATAADAELASLGGKSLQALLREKDAPAAPFEKEVDDFQALLETKAIDVDGATYRYRVALDVLQVEALSNGHAVILEAQADTGEQRLVRLALTNEKVTLNQAALAEALASRRVGKSNAAVRIRIDGEVARSLLAGSSATVAVLDEEDRVVRRMTITPAPGSAAPGTRLVDDLAAFIAAPTAPDAEGQLVPITLSTADVANLRDRGEAIFTVEGGTLRIAVVQTSREALMANGGQRGDNSDPGNEGGGGKVTPVGSGGGVVASPATPAPPQGGAPMTFFPFPFYVVGTVYVAPLAQPPAADINSHVEPRLPSGKGIPVAVMVPWRQTWTLSGFSRGALLSSLALTPQEEVVIEMRSWESRSRSLDQSSETETEQSFELSDTTKDSDETFDELTKKQDFTWQVGGSLDVSYSPGVASINVSANASAESVQNLASVARTTASRVHEATSKAAATVRARRVTRISETIETGSENRIARRIRNANLTRTVTYDFFETLAHYTVELHFQPERLSVVALIRNPELRQPVEFTSVLVRQNETTFRNALLEPSLVDGFAALRLLAAYQAACGILDERDKAAKCATAVRDEAIPAEPQPSDPPDPAAAQREAVMEALRAIHTAAKTLRDKANIDIPLQRIREQSEIQLRPMNEDERRGGQYWLFVQCLSARMPALLDQLQAIAAVDAAKFTTQHAQQLGSALPGQASPRSLASLSELTAGEKEECGLANAINRWKRVFWDWEWWTARCREELLYSPNDAGIVGNADKLAKALEAWEAKRAEGDFVKDKDVALKQADAKQDAAMSDDQLSMSFPLDEHARAVERADALLGHIAAHTQHYSYALFQALTPSEQVARILAASGGQLQVGLFEPRVVAMHGHRLAVPLTPLAIGGLQSFMSTLRTTLTDALGDAAQEPDTLVLPTPGVNVSSRLGKCAAAESFVEDSRAIDVETARARLKQAQAEADSAAAEADRRRKLIEANTLTPFEDPA